MNSGKPPPRLFKKLTIENWLEADPVMKHFAIRNANAFRHARAEDWAKSFLSLDLSEAVPKNVRDLFEWRAGCACTAGSFIPCTSWVRINSFALTMRLLGLSANC